METKGGARLSCLCPIKKSGAAPIRLGSPAQQPRSPPPPTATAVDHELPSARKESWGLRRIMVAVASEAAEGKGALEWALSHSIHGRNDTIILLNVVEPTRCCEKCAKEKNARRYQMLHALQNICHSMRPEIKVELSLVGGGERGPAIVAEARKRMASLLVLGQKNTRSLSWSSLAACAGNGTGHGGGGVVDYCIQNASCMTLAVMRKSKRGGGGYLITTKHHKNFWLLA